MNKWNTSICGVKIMIAGMKAEKVKDASPSMYQIEYIG